MKNKFFAVLGLLVSLFLSGCYERPITTTRSDNAAIAVELLFTYDGVKVYRFQDGGRFVYYTDARGRVEWTTSTSTGKSSTVQRHSVETAQ